MAEEGLESLHSTIKGDIENVARGGGPSRKSPNCDSEMGSPDPTGRFGKKC